MTDILNFFFFFLVKRAGRHFGIFKRAGRHEKGAGRRALQKKPRQNTEIVPINPGSCLRRIGSLQRHGVWAVLPCLELISCNTRGRLVTIPEPRGRKSLQTQSHLNITKL